MNRPPEGSVPSEKPLWVFSYEITPLQSLDRFKDVQTILDQEQAEAKGDARTFQGRLVTEECVSHILIVSDTPLQHDLLNDRLEEALQKINASASLTVPLEVDREAPPGPAPPDDSGPRIAPTLPLPAVTPRNATPK